MKTRTLLASAALVLLAALPALALKLLVHLTPRNLAAQGFAVRANKQENGTIEFRVTRDLSKSHWPGRSAMLEIRGTGTSTVRRLLEPEKRDNTLTYRFEIAPADAARATLTISEVQTDRYGNKLVGGGTIYEFRLADYAVQPAER
jgi:hypothetical protein